MAKFKKGESRPANAGRKKGTPNKKTQEELQRVEFVLSVLEETLLEDIEQLSARERVKMWEILQEYIRPKLARTELTGKDGEKLENTTVINVMDEDQAKRLREIEKRLKDRER